MSLPLYSPTAPACSPSRPLAVPLEQPVHTASTRGTPRGVSDEVVASRHTQTHEPLRASAPFGLLQEIPQ